MPSAAFAEWVLPSTLSGDHSGSVCDTLVNMNASEVSRFEKSVKSSLGLELFSVFLTRNGDLKLHDIRVPKKNRGGGFGTKAMMDLCEFADAHHRRIVLSPATKNDDGTTSRSRLVKFYKRFGFVENKGRKKDFAISEGMYREPMSR